MSPSVCSQLSTLRKSALVMLKSMKAYEKDMKKEEKKEKGGEGDGDGENEGDEEDLEAEMLEKMIEKLARIVKHVLVRPSLILVFSLFNFVE